MRTSTILPALTLLLAATASCGASATLLRETDAGGDESSVGPSGSGSTATSGSNGGNGASGSSTPASGSISASGSSNGGGSGSAPGGTGASGSASSGAGGPGADAGMGSCVHDSDCPRGGLCGYPEKAACSAMGQCFQVPPNPFGPGPVCQAIAPGCACDGTLTNLTCNGLPSGYAPKPLRYAGSCMDGAAGSCVHDGDCASGEYCGYAISATCSATGQCLPTPKGPACMSIAQGCGCDGTAVGIPCDRLPSAPVRHSGACSSGPTGSTCTANSDCRTFSDYCTGCNCDALATSDPNPPCSGPGVSCFADPCRGHTAVCDSTHHCAIQ
jgi:hypothetical protein